MWLSVWHLGLTCNLLAPKGLGTSSFPIKSTNSLSSRLRLTMPLSLEDHPVVLKSLLQPRLYLHQRHLLTSSQRLQPSTHWQASWSPHAFENSVTLVDHIPWAKRCCKLEILPKPFGPALCADSEEISSYPANGADLLFITADSSVQLISSHRLLAKISYKCPLAKPQ